MAMVNVNRKVTDQFYRYKMPKLVAKVEGKGNGIKTVIVNMVDIAKALYRPPAYPTKFFGCELGAQTQIDKKNDRYIVNGSHTNDKLQEILDLFIEKFVLCEQCENPETALLVQAKKEKITAACAACGHQASIDMTHRLSIFILKNPPVDDSATPAKVKKAQKNSKENGADAEDDSESGFDGWSDDPPPISKSDAKDDWSEDTSVDAVQKRMENLGLGIKGLTYNDDLEKTVEERFNIFFKHVKNMINGGVESLNDKEIVLEAERLDIKDRAVIALAELLLNADILSQVAKYRMLFLRFLHNNAKSQKQFLGAFELIVSTYCAQLLPKVAHILKAFYDNDLVEEEVMLEWGQKVSRKYVDKALSEKIHEKAKPFLDWLKDAEEESESDEDDEQEDVEVDFTHKATVNALKENPIKPAPVAASNDDDGDEVNIDDI